MRNRCDESVGGDLAYIPHPLYTHKPFRAERKKKVFLFCYYISLKHLYNHINRGFMNMNDNPKIFPNPSDPASPHTPVIYEEDNFTVEYKHVERNLQKEKLLPEEELNKFGEENWELVTVFSHESTAHYYFRRLKRA